MHIIIGKYKTVFATPTYVASVARCSVLTGALYVTVLVTRNAIGRDPQHIKHDACMHGQ
jgi:hypothetical protein